MTAFLKFHKKKTIIISLVIAFLFLLNASLAFVYFTVSRVAGATATSGASTTDPELTEVDMTTMNFQELSAYLKKIAEVKGAEYAFEILKKATLPKNVDIHLLAHTIGDMLYKQKGAEGIQYCTHDFRNACSHSIVIGLYLKEGESAITKLAPLCQKAPGGKGAYGMCFHGLGHGVLALSDYDMKRAVSLCDKLSPGTDKTEARQCIGGTTMEMVAGVHDRETWELQKSNYLTEDPLSPCNMDFVPAYAKPMCYSYLTPSLFTAAGGSLAAPDAETYKKAFPYCDALSPDDKENRGACFGGFGKEFIVLARGKEIRDVSTMTTFEMQQVYDWCELAGSTDGEEHCLSYALGSLYWGGENDVSAAVKFCTTAQGDEEKAGCFIKLTGLVDNFVGDKSYRRSYCASIPASLQTICKERLL